MINVHLESERRLKHEGFIKIYSLPQEQSEIYTTYKQSQVKSLLKTSNLKFRFLINKH
jgi:hypothetical protein